MPNHVTNELAAPSHVIDSLSRGDSLVDFNTVVPMPEILNGESATPMIEDWAKIALGITNLRELAQPAREHPATAFKRGDYGSAADSLHRSNVIRMISEGPFPKDMRDQEFELLIQYMRALRQHGHANWYDWRITNWGTKWNAYEAVRRSPDVVRFQTAWSAPIPILDALSRKFPEERMRLRWADENFGCNVGDFTVRNGDVLMGGRLENSTRESRALALELIYDGKVPEHMRLTADGDIEFKGE